MLEIRLFCSCIHRSWFIMIKSLRKIYFLNLAPVAAGFMVLGLGKSLHAELAAGYPVPIFFTVLIFVLSAVTCLALPILIRTLFADSVKDKKNVTGEEFLKFEKNLLYAAMITPWFSLIGYLCLLPKFYLATINLLALYAVYYYCPSKKRINFDKKIFRVK